jgi:hypothetical protein
LGGFALLAKYGFSLPKALEFSYPEYNWDKELFHAKSRWQALLSNTEGRASFLKELETQLGIVREEEWNKVSQHNLNGIKLPPTWK